MSMLSGTEKVITSLMSQNQFQNSISKLKYKKTGLLSFFATGKNTQNLLRDLVNFPIKNFKGNRNIRKMYVGVALERITDTSPKILNNLNKLISLEYSLDNFHRSNQDTCLVHKPAVFEGQWVQSGDLLADCSASVGGELALGQNILIAYMPWEGYNFEDAILVSERLVYDDLYTSVHIERYEVELRETKLGFEEITREIPDVDQASLKNLNVSGIAKLGSWVEEGDILVGKVTPINKKSQSNYQKLLYTILDKTVLPIRDSSLRAPKGIKAKVIGIQIFKTSKNLMPLKNFPNRQKLSPTNFKTGENLVSKDFFRKAFFPEKKENRAPLPPEKSLPHVEGKSNSSYALYTPSSPFLPPLWGGKPQVSPILPPFFPPLILSASQPPPAVYPPKGGVRMGRGGKAKLRSRMGESEGGGRMGAAKQKEQGGIIKISARTRRPKKTSLNSIYKENLSQKSGFKKESNQPDIKGTFLSSKIRPLKSTFSPLCPPGKVLFSAFPLPVEGENKGKTKITQPHSEGNLTLTTLPMFPSKEREQEESGALEDSEKFFKKLYQQQAEVYNQNNIFFTYKDHFKIFSYSLSKRVSENFFNFYPDGFLLRKFSLEAFQKNKFGLSFEMTHNKIISSDFTKNIRNTDKKVYEKKMSNLSENLNFLKNFFTNYRNRSSFYKNKMKDFPLWTGRFGFVKKRESRFDIKHLRSIFSSVERKYIDFATNSSLKSSLPMRTESDKIKENPNIFSKKGPMEGFLTMPNFSPEGKKSTLSLKIDKNYLSKTMKYSQEIERLQENPPPPSKSFASFVSPKKKGLLKISSSNTYGKNTLKGISSVQVYLAEKRRIQVGDKMAGRHGNKGIISQILPIEDMPFLPDGKPLDMVLNPLGVPSRMNVGQIYECLLGLAGKHLGENYKVFPFDEIYGAEASRSFVYSKLYSARAKTGKKWLFNQNSPGKIRLYDGRTGETFDQAITVGYAYMLRLVHMVDDKIHARSTGPYSLVTQQPLRGRSKQGGQRLGEMEVWALEGYGAAFTLLEMLTIKSDDMTGRMTLWSNLILNKEISIGTPESFKVLICELQALCLDIGLFKVNSKKT